MPHSFMRQPAASNDAQHRQTDLFWDEENPGWPDEQSEIELTYLEPEDEDETVVEADSGELEATMMSNLEAVASAFWMENGPELAPRGDTDERAPGESWPVAAPSLDPEDESWDFREPRNDELVGPRRGALLDFRPSRARRERPVHPKNDGHVAERAQPNGGAFAEDLAARNKEFYDLLEEPSTATRKIAPATPSVRPGFRSFFAGDPEVHRPPFVPQPAPARRGFRRQAFAIGILVIAVGAGAAVIATRSGAIATPSSAVAATATEEELPLTEANKDDGSRAPSEAVPKVVKTERVTVVDSEASPAAPAVDPGTLATPPLYEEPPATAATTSPLASLDLRPTEAEAAIAAPTPRTVLTETVREKTTEVAPAPALANQEPVVEAAKADPVKVDPELAAKPDKPAPKKTATAEPKSSASSGTSKAFRTGTAKVNMAVNMRRGPDNDAGVVKVVPAGARVDIVACKAWCEVIAGGDRGYIFQRFLDKAPGPQASAAAPKEQVVKASEQADDHKPLDLLRLVSPAN